MINPAKARSNGGRWKKRWPDESASLEDAVLEAARRCGEDGRGKGGLTGYFKSLAWKHPRIFVPLLAKLLQHELTAPGGEAHQASVTPGFEAIDLSNRTTKELSDIYLAAVAAPRGKEGN